MQYTLGALSRSMVCTSSTVLLARSPMWCAANTMAANPGASALRLNNATRDPANCSSSYVPGWNIIII